MSLVPAESCCHTLSLPNIVTSPHVVVAGYAERGRTSLEVLQAFSLLEKMQYSQGEFFETTSMGDVMPC